MWISNDNWIQYRKSSEKLSDDDVSQFRGKDKCVGQRGCSVKPMFFEFFTKPFTRIEIENKEKFQEIRDEIIAAGWNDLS